MSSPVDPRPRLRLRGVAKSFGRVPVLDGVDLDIAPGGIVLLAGSNGSGKTTLLRCVAGLAHHEGHITLDGRPCMASRAGRAAVGYLPQNLGFPSWPSAGELVTLFERLRDATVDALELPPGFLPPLDLPVGHLSGGQRQRLAVAIALLGRPRLLLLDEPAANLDDDGRRALADVLVGARADGASVLVAAPSPDDLGLLPDRTVRLVAGRVRPVESSVRREDGPRPPELNAVEVAS